MSLASSAFAVGNYANNNVADGIDYIGLFGYLEDRSTKRFNVKRAGKKEKVPDIFNYTK